MRIRGVAAATALNHSLHTISQSTRKEDGLAAWSSAMAATSSRFCYHQSPMSRLTPSPNCRPCWDSA